MLTLVSVMIVNTLIASIFALIAYLASRAGRPALAHVVWLLVLLKLLTPPLWHVHVAIDKKASDPIVEQAIETESGLARALPSVPPQDHVSPHPVPAVTSPADAEVAPATAPRSSYPRFWQHIFVSLW